MSGSGHPSQPSPPRPAFARDVRGAVAAELAMIVPLLALIVMNVVDLASYLYTKMQVQISAQEAVGYVRAKCDDATKLPATTNCGTVTTTGMDAAAQQTSLGTNVTLTNKAEGYYCANAGGTLVSVAAGTATCTGVVAGSTAPPGLYYAVQANYSYSPIIPGVSIAAHLTSPITQIAWIRLK